MNFTESPAARFESGAIANVGDVEALSYSQGFVVVAGQGFQIFSIKF